MANSEASAPPHKRQRTQKQPARRKRGSLSNIMTLPIDVFSLIASYLLPLDILFLSRSNKFFRDLLMTKSSRAIWINAMKNVKGLPDCPRGMSEPQYVTLLFTNVCSLCGTLSRGQVDEFLLVRLCVACKNEELVRLQDVPDQLQELVPYSTKRMGSLDFAEFDKFFGVARRSELRAIRKQYNNLVVDDKDEFKSWVKRQKQVVAKRRSYAAELGKYLDALEAQRGDEKKQLLKDRRTQIKEKLLALGWEKGDMKFNPYGSGAREWHDLVEMPKQPKPLTDRIWKNLYAKLQPFLEVNRQKRLKRERLQLKIRRRYCLEKVLCNIQRQEPPLLKVKPRQPVVPVYYSHYRSPVQRDVFPFFQDALEWPFVQELDEEGPSVETFRKGLEEHRAEMDAHISEWQEETRTILADLLREEGLVYYALLQAPKNMDPTLFSRLSEDHKLLLRADSLFYIDDAFSSSVRPYPYDRALRALYPTSPEYAMEPWEPGYDSDPDSDAGSGSESASPDINAVHRYAAAQEVARELLVNLGKPNASFLEMDQLYYTCQRCHDKKPRGWTEIIEHYLDQRRIATKINKNSSALAQDGVVYYDVHVSNDTPMVKQSKPKEPVKVAVRKCSLCAKKSIRQSVVTSTPHLYRHLLEVHCVTQPQSGVHYQSATIPAMWDEPGYGYGYEDGDEDDQIEDIEADNEPEKEVEEEEYVHEGDGFDDEDESGSESESGSSGESSGSDDSE